MRAKVISKMTERIACRWESEVGPLANGPCDQPTRRAGRFITRKERRNKKSGRRSMVVKSQKHRNNN